MLDFEDTTYIINVLASNSFFLKIKNIETVFSRAGLDDLLPDIDLTGAPRTMLHNVIRRLNTKGKITYDHHALGRFLNAAMADMEIDDRNKIKTFIIQKKLINPASVSLVAPEEKTPVHDEVRILHEGMTGENTLKPIGFLLRAIEISQCVCCIVYPGGSGTGFLISNNCVLTNNHVIGDTQELDECVFRFNYHLNTDNLPAKFQDYRYDKKGLFHTNKGLDYSVLQLVDSPGQKWGLPKFTLKTPELKSRVNIIQHPGGSPKQISIQNNFLEYVDNRITQYLTSTQPGSSGSPVFNNRWHVLAIHHGETRITDPDTGRTYYRNEGIRMSRIIEDLPQNIKALLTV